MCVPPQSSTACLAKMVMPQMCIRDSYTVGKALYAMMKQGDANRFYEGWSGTKQLAAAAVELFRCV